MFKKITALSLSLILALTAALCFSSAPAQAAQQPTFNNVSEDAGNGWYLFYNASGNLIPSYDYLDNYGNTGRYLVKYKAPLQLAVRNGSSSGLAGQYVTGVLAFNVAFNWNLSQVYSSGNAYQYISYPEYNGEGFSWSFRPHGPRSGSIVIILDNYQTSNYGIPGPDWWIHLEAEMTNLISLGSNYNAFDFDANFMVNTLNTSSEPGTDLSAAISAAINNSSSIQDILSILNAIAADTDLLQSVVNKLDNISGVLANVYSELQQGNVYLNRLGWALAGIDIQAADGNTVSQAVYDRWVAIIKKAMDDSAPDMDEQESQLDDANQQLANQESLEEDVYEFTGDNISSINWNLEVPDQIAGAALIIMAMVEKIWAKLGILQFAVTAACMVGLVTIVLGVVNRFSSIKARESGRAAKGNKSPGNENKTN